MTSKRIFKGNYLEASEAIIVSKELFEGRLEAKDAARSFNTLDSVEATGRAVGLDISRTPFMDLKTSVSAIKRQWLNEMPATRCYAQGSFYAATFTDFCVVASIIYDRQLGDINGDKSRRSQKKKYLLPRYTIDRSKESLGGAFVDEKGVLCGLSVAFDPLCPELFIIALIRHTTEIPEKREVTILGAEQFFVKEKSKQFLRTTKNALLDILKHIPDESLRAEFENMFDFPVLGDVKVNVDNANALNKKIVSNRNYNQWPLKRIHALEEKFQVACETRDREAIKEIATLGQQTNQLADDPQDAEEHERISKTLATLVVNREQKLSAITGYTKKLFRLAKEKASDESMYTDESEYFETHENIFLEAIKRIELIDVSNSESMRLLLLACQLDDVFYALYEEGSDEVERFKESIRAMYKTINVLLDSKVIIDKRTIEETLAALEIQVKEVTCKLPLVSLIAKLISAKQSLQDTPKENALSGHIDHKLIELNACLMGGDLFEAEILEEHVGQVTRLTNSAGALRLIRSYYAQEENITAIAVPTPFEDLLEDASHENELLTQSRKTWALKCHALRDETEKQRLALDNELSAQGLTVLPEDGLNEGPDPAKISLISYQSLEDSLNALRLVQQYHVLLASFVNPLSEDEIIIKEKVILKLNELDNIIDEKGVLLDKKVFESTKKEMYLLERLELFPLYDERIKPFKRNHAHRSRTVYSAIAQLIARKDPSYQLHIKEMKSKLKGQNTAINQCEKKSKEYRAANFSKHYPALVQSENDLMGYEEQYLNKEFIPLKQNLISPLLDQLRAMHAADKKSKVLLRASSRGSAGRNQLRNIEIINKEIRAEIQILQRLLQDANKDRAAYEALLDAYANAMNRLKHWLMQPELRSYADELSNDYKKRTETLKGKKIQKKALEVSIKECETRILEQTQLIEDKTSTPSEIPQPEADTTTIWSRHKKSLLFIVAMGALTLLGIFLIASGVFAPLGALVLGASIATWVAGGVSGMLAVLGMVGVGYAIRKERSHLKQRNDLQASYDSALQEEVSGHRTLREALQEDIEKRDSLTKELFLFPEPVMETSENAVFGIDDETLLGLGKQGLYGTVSEEIESSRPQEYEDVYNYPLSKGSFFSTGEKSVMPAKRAMEFEDLMTSSRSLPSVLR